MTTIRINPFTFLLLCFSFFGFSQAKAQVFEKIVNWDYGPEGNFNTTTACANKSNGNHLAAFRKQTFTGLGAAALAEINNNGDTLWVKQFSRIGTAYGESFISIIKELPNDQLLLVGGSYSSSQYYHATFWITDNQGNISTFKRMDYNNFREITINDVAIDDDGSIYFGGNYYDFLSAGQSFYNWTVPLFGKFNPDLTLAWAKTYGSPDHTSFNYNIGDVKSIKLTNEGDLLVYGLDGKHNQNNPGTIHIFKVNNLGETIWNKQKPSNSFGGPVELVVSETGDFYTCVKISIFVPPFGPNIYTTTLEKFDSDGALLWSKSYGTEEIQDVSSIRVDDENELIYLSARTMTPGAEYDGLLTVIDFSGELVFCKSYDNSALDGFNDVIKNETNYLLVGTVSTVGGWIVQTDLQGNTDCAANDILLETADYPSEYTPGITTNDISFTYIDYEPQYLNGAFDIATSCYACANQSYDLIVNTCEPYFAAGELQTESGIYFDTYTSSQGCDSTIVTELNIFDVPGNPFAGEDQIVCGESSFLNADAAVNGTGTWTVISGSASIVSANDPLSEVLALGAGDNVLRWTVSNGVCEDVFDELTIFSAASSQSELNIEECGSYELNDEVYLESGTFTQVLQNQFGCDSTITLNLSILEPSAASISETTCGEEFVLNGISYAESGTYTQNLINLAGCDSTLTLELEILNIETAVVIDENTLTAVASTSNYQWVDCSNENEPIEGATEQSFTPTVNGNYAVIITENNCEEISECTEVIIIRVEEQKNDLVLIYPNPSVGAFNVQTQEEIKNVRIFNISGAEIKIDYQKGSKQVNAFDLTPGNYLIEIHLENTIVHSNLLIQ